MSPPPIEPPALPTDNVSKGKAQRVLLLWLVLIAMFAAIYHLFDSGSSGSHRAVASHDTAFPYWLLPSVGFLLYLGFYLNRLRLHGFNKDSGPGLVAMGKGDYAEAELLLTQVGRKYHRRSLTGSVALYNVAIAQLRQGKLAPAEATLTRVERWKGVLFASDVRILTAIALAEVFALRGDAGLARRWLDDARKRYDRNARAVFQLGALVLIELMVLAREGKTRELIDGFDQRRDTLEGSLTADRMRVAWLLRAFAAWREADPRDQGNLAPLLRRLESDRPDELAPLAVEWPELRTFMTTHGLIAAAAPAASA